MIVVERWAAISSKGEIHSAGTRVPSSRLNGKTPIFQQESQPQSMGNVRNKTGIIEFVSRTISHQTSSFPSDVPIKISLFFHGLSHLKMWFAAYFPTFFHFFVPFFPIFPRFSMFFSCFSGMSSDVSHWGPGARNSSGRLCVPRWCWTTRGAWAAWPRQRKLGTAMILEVLVVHH